ncbi:lamin tail domain-containing protein [Streptomyces sp. ODS28]|uniref:lamin tail domain-containing protein n=1 Tax=Streptomyces sp. ODS28 TaxID=3136688 RepID=UPI0031EFD84A
MKIRHALICGAAAGAVVLGVTVAAPAQAATYPVKFRYFQYDAPGSDTHSNSQINKEYFTLKNVTGYGVNLKGWTVRDNTGYTYTFTSSYTLKPGKSVRVHTGKGSNTSTDRYWWRSWYVWNNTGDKATLRSASGAWKDSCSWSSRGPGYIYC